MIKKRYFIFIAMLCIFNACKLKSQNNRFGAGISLGGANYQGDLVEQALVLAETKEMYGIHAICEYSSKISFQFDLKIARIGGDDKYSDVRKVRGYRFVAPVQVGLATLKWSPWARKTPLLNFDNIFSFRRNHLYFLGGIGVLRSNPNAEGLPPNSLDKLAALNQWHLTLPIGIGYYIPLKKQLSCWVEGITYATFKDYLDGVSASGNPNNNDWLATLGIGVCYFFDINKN